MTHPLRLCGYCQTWNSRPCGEQCRWSVLDPTFEAVAAQGMSTGTAKTPEAVEGRSPASPVDGAAGDAPRDPSTPTLTMGESE